MRLKDPDDSTIIQEYPPSNSPTVPSAAAQDGDRSEASSPNRIPTSPALSAASTAEDGGSSPVLPPLPQPTINGRYLELARTPPSEARTGDSRYFTASWGSPYQDASSAYQGASRQSSLHRKILSDESSEAPSDASPLRRLSLHTAYLRPAPTFGRSVAEEVEGPVSASVLLNRARRPIRGLTEDWIRQHTANDNILSEKQSWLSDNEEDEHSSLRSFISDDLEDWNTDELDPRTPTLKSFIESRDNARGFAGRRGHERFLSTATIRPEDFRSSAPRSSRLNMADIRGLRTPRTLARQDSKESLGAMSPTDKPLPVPPKDLPEWGQDAPQPPAKDSTPRDLPSLPVSTVATPLPLPLPTPRLKKKVPWKGREGKNILILLPMDDERGRPGKAPIPLTPQDVENMQKDWGQLGYNVRGFDLEHSTSDLAEGQGQSRGIWPEIDQLVEEREQHDFKVGIPDKKLWEDYVEELKKAKLRALGVSFGDEDEPPVAPPPPHTHRRTVTTYPSLPFSPPLQTSSANSMGGSAHQNAFSPALMTGNGFSTSQTSNVGSTASPGSMHPQMYGKYNPRQSISFGNSFSGLDGVGSPFQLPQMSPSVWSPQNSTFQPGHSARGMSPSVSFSPQMATFQPGHSARGASPSVSFSPHTSVFQPGHSAHGASPSVSAFGILPSPQSPFAQESYFPQNELPPHVQMQRRQTMHLQNMSARASPRLAEVNEEGSDGEGMDNATSSGSVGQQRPLNASESLQQEIDDAEYHLEEQFKQQLEHDDYSPHSEKEEAYSIVSDLPTKSHNRNQSSFHGSGLGLSNYASKNEGPILHHPQPHTRGHSLSQRQFEDAEALSPALESLAEKLKAHLSDVEAEHEMSASPDYSPTAIVHEQSLSNASNPWLESDSASVTREAAPKRFGHAVKPSMSTLNVKAPEFKFDPTTSFKPGQFSFSGANFQPSASVNNAFVPSMPYPTGNFSKSLSSTRPNAFSGSNNNVGSTAFATGHGDFNFSSVGPSFRPNAPAFTPLDSGFSGSIRIDHPALNDAILPLPAAAPLNSIFGNINMKDVVKQPKKSKAVAIIRPDSSVSGDTRSEDETLEDKDGRITQGEGRIKRARGQGRDGDSVPLFADQPMPLQETSREQLPPKENVSGSTKFADKENLPQEKRLDEAYVAAGPDKQSWATVETTTADFDLGSTLPTEAKGSFSFNIGSSPFQHPTALEQPKSQTTNKHRKSNSSLSALAKPFEFGQSWLKFGQGSSPAVAAPGVEVVEPVYGVRPESPEEEEQILSPTVSAPLRSAGLSSSRFAFTPPPIEDLEGSVMSDLLEGKALPPPDTFLPYDNDTEEVEDRADNQPTFEEIDEVMRQMTEVEHERTISLQLQIDAQQWRQPSPIRHTLVPEVDLPSLDQSLDYVRSEGPSPTLGRLENQPRTGSALRSFSRPGDFTEPKDVHAFDTVHRLNKAYDVPPSDWDDVLSQDDEGKFEARTQFFDGHVNEMINSIVTEKLHPMSKSLKVIQSTLNDISEKALSRRREMRSISTELPESDADDEDDYETARMTSRSSVPPHRGDKKMEKIRSMIFEAMAAQRAMSPEADRFAVDPQASNVMRVLEEMREQFGQSMRLDLRAEDLRNIVEEAVDKRLPAQMAIPSSDANKEAAAKVAALEVKLAEMNEVHLNMLARAAPSPGGAVGEAKAEIALLNAKVSELLDRNSEMAARLATADEKAEEEIKIRRAAEDRLAEVQRLLRISSEDEYRLREVVEEKEDKIKNLEESRSSITVRTALMEATADSAKKAQADIAARLALVEEELRESRQQAQHWQVAAERHSEAAAENKEAAQRSNELSMSLQTAIERVKLQMEESMHTRESMRGKLAAIQEGMAQAAHEVAEENAQRAKKEQELIARQEVLDAKLQAEAFTRERLEREIERLEAGERQGMRAVNDIKKLEAVLEQLRVEHNEAEKNAMKYKREFEEARESGLSEVERTRKYMQSEIDSANLQVNMARDDMENQLASARAQLDDIRLEVDTANSQTEMLVEEVKESKTQELANLRTHHEDLIEDLKTRHERQLGNAVEDAARNEQLLMERLSLSSAKMEHYQDRIRHLEEKLEISKEAARAAAQSARSQGSKSPMAATAPAPEPAPSSIAPSPSVKTDPMVTRSTAHLHLPEKISPQALRESIMVLQEQLQDRETKIEQLEQRLSTMDPEANSKILKRDDEILWLRELLSVRISDLQDIITTCSQETFNPAAVKDAAIRLKANVQMEEQERQRALNGGSSILPSTLERTLKDAAASPRVAQVVGPMAAAWGNWRARSGQQTQQSSNRNISEIMSSTTTPSRPPTSGSGSSQTSLLSGLLTPPSAGGAQPTAFGSTGKRFSAQQLANRPKPPPGMRPARSTSGIGSRQGTKGLGADRPSTPPMMASMMRGSSYDRDAGMMEFEGSDGGFFDNDD